MDEIMVSVCMLAYNHEKYIRKALDSVLNQKTNFKFEILIHDDASPDNTANIIREYEKKYPDIVKPIYQKENQFSKGVKVNAIYQYPRVKGKYIALCECDDYWTDEFKLQKQVDFLEKHPDIVSVAHRYKIINENDEIIGISHEGIELNKYFNKDDALKYRSGTFHPNSILYRSFVVRDKKYIEGQKKCCILGGHTFLIYYLASLSDIYIMDDCMSAWRYVVKKNGTSYASRSNAHPISYNIKLLDMYYRYDEFFEDEYNFKPIIRQMLLICIKIIIKNKEDNINKFDAIKKCLNLASWNDICSLPYYELTKGRLK